MERMSNQTAACALCGKECEEKLISVWSEWDSKCAESLCEIFALDTYSYSSYFQNALARYCASCLQLVWDIDFKHRAIEKLGETLSSHRHTFESLFRGNKHLSSLRVVLDGILSDAARNSTPADEYHQFLNLKIISPILCLTEVNTLEVHIGPAMEEHVNQSRWKRTITNSRITAVMTQIMLKVVKWTRAPIPHGKGKTTKDK